MNSGGEQIIYTEKKKQCCDECELMTGNHSDNSDEMINRMREL
jgi:hypothetical protein